MWGAQWLSPFSGQSSPPSSVSNGSPTPKNTSSAASTAPPRGNGGGLNVGDAVEYFSASKADWIPARVLAINANGTFNLDVKPNVTPDKVRAVGSSAVAAAAAAPSPQAAYAAGEVVQYFSASGGAWIQARVTTVNADGTYDLDCKPRVPATKIRKQEAATAAVSSPNRAPPGSASNGYPEHAGEGRAAPPSSSSRAPASSPPPAQRGPGGGYTPGSVQRETPGSHASAAPEPPHVTHLRRRLTEATMSGDMARLQAVLDEARQCGVVGPEVVQAREAIQGMEAVNMHQHAMQVVDEAIESEDFWKLQAAMATAVGSGMHSEVSRIQEAMRTCKRRNEHVRELRRAADARDAAALRRAIEVALQDHVQEKHVRPARDALRAMEARASAGQQLRQALSVRSVALLQGAVEAAQSAGIDVNDPELGESIRAARTELHSKALEQLHGLLQAQDSNGLKAALQEWRARGLDEAALAPFAKKVQALEVCGRLRQDLQGAMRSHDPAALQAALQTAEAAGLGEADLRAAKDMLRAHQAREAQERQRLEAREAQERQQREAREAQERQREAQERQRQEREAQQRHQREQEYKNAMEAQQRSAAARSAVAEDLRSALRGNNVDRLAAAIAAAERAGLGHGPEVVQAEERLRALRSQSSASRDLEEALQSGDVYKLRAAIATARGTGVGDAELRRAEGALRTFSAQAQSRRALETAMASRNAEMLRAAVEDAKRAGLPQEEVRRAEIALSSMTHTSVTQELRSAMAAGNVEKLRVAAGAAMDAGHESGTVAAAWAQVRSLEWQQSARRELQKATSSGDGARLQAAIEHAQSAGLGEAELAPARAELHMRAGRQQVQHDLQLARASGDVQMLRDKLKAARDAGLSGGLVESAAAELNALEMRSAYAPALGFSPPSPRFPGQQSHAYEATAGAYTVPETNPHWHPGY